MGRTKLWTERLHLTLPDGAKDRIDSVLRPKEDRLTFIREAVDREIERRQADLKGEKTAAEKRLD